VSEPNRTRRASPPARQRLVIVSASTAEYDSRGDRYARSAAERGHDVTVVARWHDGLARDVSDPSGFRTIRLVVHAMDGLPFGRWLRLRLPILLRLGRPGATIGSDVGAEADAASGHGSRTTVRASVVRRLRPLDWAVARLRIPLAIRAQTSAAVRAAPPADVYLAMGIWAIPAALALGRRHAGRVIYDIGDLYLEARGLARLRGPLRSYLERAERHWARKADALITANEFYADLIVERLATRRPTVILNVPPRYEPPAEAPQHLRDAAGLPVSTPIVLYHGGLFAERGIEQLIDAIAEVPGTVLVLMGYGTLAPAIERRIRGPESGRRVVLLPPVPPHELPAWVASADIVAIPIQPTTLNHRYSMPNKLWEAIAVGVPIVASDLPGMAAIVRELDAGVLVDPTDPAAIAGAIRELLGRSAASRAAMRKRLLAAARTQYSWDVQVETYLALLGDLTGKPW
jgi:glycosyltransferase involved in cell wall biosynthesis